MCSGTSPDDRLVEAIELPDHPFFVASQYHPEFKSRPLRPQPLFRDFVGASLERAARPRARGRGQRQPRQRRDGRQQRARARLRRRVSSPQRPSGCPRRRNVDVGDREAGAGQHARHRPRQVAAAEQPLLERLEPVLPAAHALVRRQAVLDEVHRAPGLSTRRTSDSAVATSGIVHSVQWTGRRRSCRRRTEATGRPGRSARPARCWRSRARGRASSPCRRARSRPPASRRRGRTARSARSRSRSRPPRPRGPAQTRRRCRRLASWPQARLVIRGRTWSP